MIKPEPPAVPDWAERMVVGHWYRISGDRPDLDLPPTPVGTRFLIDNDPARDPRLNPPRNWQERARRLLGREPLSPWHGSCGFAAITECWNGAVLASQLGRSGSMVCFGGGHDDYFGSDVHRFDLASRQWSRILDGYVAGGPDDYGAGAIYPDSVYPDGSPLPPHTYGYLQYDPVGNDMLLFKGQIELGPNVRAVSIPHLLNLDELKWRHGPEHPNGIFNSGGWTTWDPGRRRLWGHSGDDGGGDGLTWFAPDHADRLGRYGSWGPLCGNKLPDRANHNAMQIDHLRDVLVVVSHAADGVFFLDPDMPESQLVRVRESGSRPPIQEYSALEYSAALESIVYYTARSGTRISLLQAPTTDVNQTLAADGWKWRPGTAKGNALDPVTDAAAHSRFSHHKDHVFGRFRVLDYSDMTLAVLIRHVDSPVYSVRLK